MKLYTSETDFQDQFDDETGNFAAQMNLLVVKDNLFCSDLRRAPNMA